MNGPFRFGRVTVRPTLFGLAMVAAVVAVFAARGTGADPAMSGLVWASLAAVTAIGWVWPVVAITLVRVTEVDAPSETRVGLPGRVRVHVASPVPVPSLRYTLDPLELVGGTAALEPPGAHFDEVVPSRRGVFERLSVVVTTSGPVGMLSVSRSADVVLPRPMVVGPQPVPQAWHPEVSEDAGVDGGGRPANGGGDEVRSVRPYRAGDPAHLVHWPSSARTGSLVVREMEPPHRPTVVIVVEVPPAPEDPDEAAAHHTSVEASIGRAAGLGEAVLRTGGGVLLCTNEDGRAVTAEVHGERQLNRRLAAAGPGEVRVPR